VKQKRKNGRDETRTGPVTTRKGLGAGQLNQTSNRSPKRDACGKRQMCIECCAKKKLEPWGGGGGRRVCGSLVVKHDRYQKRGEA